MQENKLFLTKVISVSFKFPYAHFYCSSAVSLPLAKANQYCSTLVHIL